MSLYGKEVVTASIVEKAMSSGASLAGIASAEDLRNSPSYKRYGEAHWSLEAKSVLVLALAHEETRPEMDWWDGDKGTLGNRQLIEIGRRLAEWLNDKYNIVAQDLPYHVEKGGIFLKDAAVLAGLGKIGANNLLVTPNYGPRVRLRALSLDAELEPNGPIKFDCCKGCDMPCRRACPQNAFGEGVFNREICNEQMERDKANGVKMQGDEKEGGPYICVKYCRVCELSCPVGK